MADPLSVTANIVAVLGFSIQSCNYLVDFFTRVADAPAEVEHNIVWLQALHSTFSELHALSQDALFRDAHVELPSGFNARLEDCKTDLAEMESRVRHVGRNLKAGRIQQTWTRVRYCFTAEQRLTKFSRRLQTYQTTFTLDLMMIQIKLSVQIHSNQIGKPALDRAIEESVKEPCISCANYTQFTRFLGSYVEPISVRASTWYSVETCLGRFAFWSGPTVKQRWLNKRPVYDVSSLKGENGFGFQVHVGRRNKHKGTSIVFVLMKCPKAFGSLSIRWNISFPRIVPKEADVFEFIRTRNLAALKAMFNMRKATPLYTSSDGTGLLHIAVKFDSLEIVRFLLQEGVEVNSRDEDGQTPLHLAITKSDNYDICRVLLEHGADLGSRDIAGRTPLHTFFSSVVGMILANHREAIDDEIMAPDTAGMTILQYAAWSSKSEPQHLVPYLQVGEMYPVLTRDYAGRSLLHFAAQRGNIEILKYLLVLPHDVGMETRDTSGQSVLHYAVHSKRIEAIDLLVSNGADIYAVDTKCRTLLHCAAARNSVAAIERVVALCGRNSLSLRDEDGRTPAELACRYKALEAVECLKSLGFERPDFMRQFHPPKVESRAESPGSLACYVYRGALKSTHLVAFMMALLWYIFHASGKWHLPISI